MFYDLFNTETGEWIKDRDFKTQPAQPAGKPWAWQVQVKPTQTEFNTVAWDIAQRAWVATDKPLEDVQVRLIEKIKADANNRILESLPEWKQRNLIARAAELSDKRIDGPLTAEEESERQALKGEWAGVTAIREASDTAEANVTAAQSVAAAIAAYEAWNA